MTTIVLSHSQIATWRQCLYKYKIKYRDNWADTSGPAARLGLLWHELMEDYYNPAGQPADRLMQWDAGFWPEYMDEAYVEERQEALVKLAWMLQGYAEHYVSDEWCIVAQEAEHEIVLAPAEGDLPEIRLYVRVDMLASLGTNPALWLVDHKTAGQMPRQLQLDLDDQFTLYTAALRRLGYDVRGVLHNCVLTRMNKVKPQELSDRFQRTPMVRNRAEGEQALREVVTYARWLHQAPDELLVRMPHPESCQRRCGFVDGCLHERKGYGEIGVFLQSAGFKHREPRS